MQAIASRATSHSAAPACGMRITRVLSMLLFPMPLAQSGPAREFDVTWTKVRRGKPRMLARADGLSERIHHAASVPG